MMSETMMALGAFRFSLDTAAYQDFKRSQTYRWQSQERLLRRPALQFIGLGEETIELNGLIYPHFRGSLTQVETMRIVASKGSPLVLVDGLGFVWGQWVIKQISEGQTVFQPNGQPLKQTFQLSLSRYGDDIR
jgi:phage protein U